MGMRRDIETLMNHWTIDEATELMPELEDIARWNHYYTMLYGSVIRKNSIWVRDLDIAFVPNGLPKQNSIAVRYHEDRILVTVKKHLNAEIVGDDISMTGTSRGVLLQLPDARYVDLKFIRFIQDPTVEERIDFDMKAVQQMLEETKLLTNLEEEDGLERS